MTVNNGKFVKDAGSLEAKLVLIGEAPGFYEAQSGQPFMGASGQALLEWWKIAGLNRPMFYITNVYPYQPPNNDISKIPPEEMEHWIKELHLRLCGLSDPYIIVPTGETALEALLGKKGISKLRGSILSYTDLNGREIKVIPTLHPAGVLKMKSMEGRCIQDWKKIAQECQFKDLRLPERRHYIKPTIQEVKDYVASFSQEYPIVKVNELPISIDIETHPKSGITCVGFALTAKESFVIPIGLRRKVESTKRVKDDGLKARIEDFWAKRVARALYNTDTTRTRATSMDWWKKSFNKALEKWEIEKKITKKMKDIVVQWEMEYEIPQEAEPQKSNLITIGYWKTQEEADEALGYVKQLCESPNPKIMQNGFYDEYWLWWNGINVQNYMWDTMFMHHCLNANDEHSLHYLASIYLREPYWKDECKEPGEMEKYGTYGEALWNYNGLDCTCTFELYEILKGHLEATGRLEFYDRHYRQLQEPLMAMMQHGIRVDVEKMKALREAQTAELGEILLKINEVSGKELSAKKKVSPAKLAKYFYEDLMLPKQMRRRQKGEKTASVDEVAVRTLMLRFPQVVGEVGELYLRSQRCSAVLGFLQEARVDEDGRFRSSYKLAPKTGRLASAANPRGTGANAQNQDRDIREIFLADKGMFLLEIDMAQIESRIVYMLTRDPKLIEEAQTPPWVFDMHTANARAIFMQIGSLPPGQDPTKEQRYLGKKAVHGAQRAMHGKRLSNELLKETPPVVITPEEGEAMINAYHAAKPAVRDVYFQETAREVRDNRKLTNSWGRVLEWPYNRFDDELYREAYSFRPQADAADLLNQWGLVPLHNLIKQHVMKTRIHIQRHDALVMSTNIAEGHYIVECLNYWLTQPVYYFGVPLSVPISVKIGLNDGEGHEWKQVPNKAEFNEVASKLILQ